MAAPSATIPAIKTTSSFRFSSSNTHRASAAAAAFPLLLPSLPPIRPFPSPCIRLAASVGTSSVPSTPSRGQLHLQRPCRRRRIHCKVSEYKFPDPIPEFAEAETDKFRTHMLERLAKKKVYFGDSVVDVVDVCTEIFSNFLQTEYGGPGTLLVIPFIDMADTLREKGLPGAPQAARAAVVWAQKHIDKDWNEWTGGEHQDSD